MTWYRRAWAMILPRLLQAAGERTAVLLPHAVTPATVRLAGQATHVNVQGTTPEPTVKEVNIELC